MNILEEIAGKTRERIREKKKHLPLGEIRRRAEASKPPKFSLEKVLGESQLSFICEVKKASPSKGVIAEEFPYLEIAKEYESAGAAAISCLTEPFWFQGRDAYLEEIARTVQVPVLRK
ncbi:MAG: indole-3-glycerol phosphate synthase, partial [Blautia sp.]